MRNSVELGFAHSSGTGRAGEELYQLIDARDCHERTRPETLGQAAVGSESQSPAAWREPGFGVCCGLLRRPADWRSLFPPKSNQVRVITGDAPTALSLLDNSQATLR